MRPDDPRHGTYAGYRAHHDAGEKACQPCLQGQRDYQNARKAGRVAAVNHGGQGPSYVTEIEWADRARCAGVPIDYTHPWSQLDPAGFIERCCKRCPAVAECDQYADEHNERRGIWGGITEKQRATRRRQRKQLTTTTETTP